VRLGKLFARNTIRNIACIPDSLSIHMQSVTKPIVVVGAGPSLDRCIAFIKQHRDYVYILAIAAAARPLKDAGISPDAIVTVESQFATEKAFIGMNNSFVPLYADISSRPKMLSVTGAKPAFFLSEYYKSPLLERIKGFFPTIPIFPPLGSVSLSATELALALRSHSGKTPPVFVCGLDFAFSPGKTHCKESPHAKEYLNTCNRLFPPGNPEAAFRYGSFKISGKNDLCLFSDNSLKGYGMIFCERYAKTSELYDISPEGMPLDIPYCDTTTASHIIEKYYKENTHLEKHNIDDCINSFENAHRFYAEEKNKLLAIRDILTKKNIFEDDIALQRIITLLEECNYVYMHFADAHKGVQIQRHFFNRVRAEIDVFLKDIEIAEKILAKSKQRPLLR
ncbi:MAG: 6-hydroxymethylpterin diphosphokinase MptE-like protein, partial [Spirochaetales bacterium]